MWVNTKKFCAEFSYGLRNLQKKIKKSIENNEKILHINTKIFSYRYIENNRGGNGGKTLQIWSKPLSEAQAKLLEKGFNIEDLENNKDNKNEQSLEPINKEKPSKLGNFAKTNHKKQNLALQKAEIVKEWIKAKGALNAKEFILLINTKKNYTIKLTENKLYAWQRAYLNEGFDALIDKRKNVKENELKKLGIEKLFEDILLAQKGRINVSNIHRLINYEAARNENLKLEDFLAKKDEFISYECVLRATRKYLRENKLVKNLILYGEDGAISRHLPALGTSNWAAKKVNDIVEIDASPMDAICKVDELAKSFNLDENIAKEWHKRYTIISLIDTFSGVASFYLGYTEDSLSIARAVAKYISKYGKPKCIHSDNGKAFLSKHIKAMLARLEIEHKPVKAYSGWAKPYVENKFKDLQNSLTANLIGYIGANVKERQAIEFFFSKKERRLKKGAKTNQRRLKTLEYMRECIDNYSEYFMNNKWLDRLGSTPKQSYEEHLEDILRIDELSLSVYLGGALKDRKVLNKGISLNGSFFYNPKLYAYEQVLVCENLNNNAEIFCFDKEKELICVANTLDLEQGVSVEVAKESKKLITRAIKNTKEKIEKKRQILEKNMEKYLELGKEKLEKTKQAKPQSENKIKNELELSKNLVSNGDFSHLLKGSKPKESKKEPSWERAAKKAGY